MKRVELSYEQKRDWIRLSRSSTIGPVAFAGLLARFGDASEALARLPEVSRSSKLSIPAVDLVEREMEMTADFGARMIAACEPDYPAYLAALDPPPPIISVAGDLSRLPKERLAVIGSRNASAVGLRFAGQISRELGQAGVAIISGLARGIDTQAHMAALETGTAAVLGGGVDHVYPASNAALYDDIKDRGAIISESPFGHRATARDFPRRNRIISGMSSGVIVIEAAERSGTLITARYALEQGREVMAAPGSPLDPRTKGCNRLIRQGAALIETAQDILDILRSLPPMALREGTDDYNSVPFDWNAAQNDITKAKAHLRGLLSPTPAPRDDLIRMSGLPVPIAAAALLELEIDGEAFVERDGRTSLAV